MGRVLLAGFIASIVIIIWSSLFWLVLPNAMHGLKAAPSEDSTLALLARDLPASGVYVLPFPPKDRSEQAFYAKYKAGPIVQIFYRVQGAAPISDKLIFLAWLHALLSAVLVAFLVTLANKSLTTFTKRWGFIVLTGTFAAIAVEGFYPIWWHHLWGYHLAAMFEQMMGWLLAGAVIAGIIQSKQ